ncbi:MAG: VWA domain-containing protein [Gammaproteobacteria bacterium]|jgi:Ca-activated chloride channel family protein
MVGSASQAAADMPEAGFHFAQPWLLLLLLVPLPVWFWLRMTSPRENNESYRAYADAHLLPFLTGRHDLPPRQQRQRFFVWCVLWGLLVTAIAGPRWDFRDVQLFRPGSDLVILLDLSSSMNVTDISPSRLTRARQEIQDLIENNRHSRLGLIGFATLAHIIAPLTEDGNSLRALLPAISTDLVELKGSRLTEALSRAQQMLAGQPANSSRHLLLITDGDFGDGNLEEYVKRLTREGIQLHVLGVGTEEGGPVPGAGNTFLRQQDGSQVISQLDEENLKKLAEVGNGIYQRAVYRDADTAALMRRVGRASHAHAVANQKTRIWNERYFWPVGLAMLLVLPLYRRFSRLFVQQEAS